MAAPEAHSSTTDIEQTPSIPEQENQEATTADSPDAISSAEDNKQKETENVDVSQEAANTILPDKEVNCKSSVFITQTTDCQSQQEEQLIMKQEASDKEVKRLESLKKQVTETTSNGKTAADLHRGKGRDADLKADEVQNLKEKLEQAEMEKSQVMKENEQILLIVGRLKMEKKSLEAAFVKVKEQLSRSEKLCSDLEAFMLETEETLKNHYKDAQKNSNAKYKEHSRKLKDKMTNLRIAQRRDSQEHEATIFELQKRIKEMEEKDSRSSAKHPSNQHRSQICTIM